jgi:hypothetical protein
VASAKKITVPRLKKLPPWAQAHPPAVVELAYRLVNEIPWPNRDRGDKQPYRHGKPEQFVPATNNALLAAHLAAAIQDGADPEILFLIGQKHVDAYRTKGCFVQGAQWFFGTSGDATWKALYQAHITNLKNQSS